MNGPLEACCDIRRAMRWATRCAMDDSMLLDINYRLEGGGRRLNVAGNQVS